MVTSTFQATLGCDVRAVWRVVTSLEDHAWRSDICRIEILSETQFREYTPGGVATTFTITAFEPCCLYAFELENEQLSGRWTGRLFAVPGGTKVVFTERVAPRRWYLAPLVRLFLKRQQRIYFRDLKKKLQAGT